MFIPDEVAEYGLVALVVLANFVPTFIGRSRGVPFCGLLLLTNFLFGWTLIGWYVCLVYAWTAKAPERPPPALDSVPYYDTHDLFPRREPRL